LHLKNVSDPLEYKNKPLQVQLPEDINSTKSRYGDEFYNNIDIRKKIDEKIKEHYNDPLYFQEYLKAKFQQEEASKTK